MGSQLISFGSVSTAFGIPYDIAVIIGVIVIIIYTYTSGMWELQYQHLFNLLFV